MSALSSLTAARGRLPLVVLAAVAFFVHSAEADPKRRVVTRAPDDFYSAWRRAETRATLALAAWRVAPQRDKGAAYATYVAALDAEAIVARLLEVDVR